jgi:hypothetical protein
MSTSTEIIGDQWAISTGRTFVPIYGSDKNDLPDGHWDHPEPANLKACIMERIV